MKNWRQKLLTEFAEPPHGGDDDDDGVNWNVALRVAQSMEGVTARIEHDTLIVAFGDPVPYTTAHRNGHAIHAKLVPVLFAMKGEEFQVDATDVNDSSKEPWWAGPIVDLDDLPREIRRMYSTMRLGSPDLMLEFIKRYKAAVY